jgi:hypothetical protein
MTTPIEKRLLVYYVDEKGRIRAAPDHNVDEWSPEDLAKITRTAYETLVIKTSWATYKASGRSESGNLLYTLVD